MENDSLKTAHAAAERLAHTGKLEEAIALLKPQLPLPFTELSEESGDAVFTLSSLYLLTEKFKEGEKLIEAALTVASPEQLADLHRRRSHFYEARGHPQKATAERQKSAQAEEFQSDPGQRAFLRVLRVSGERDPAQTYQACQEALEILPKNRVAVSALLCLAAGTAYDAGNYDEALRLASATITHPKASNAERAHALSIKAILCAAQGEYAPALDRLREATYLVRNGADWQTATELALRTASCLLLLGNTRAAEALAQETIELFPIASSAAHTLRIQCACCRGELAVAVEYLQSAEASTRQRHRLAPARATIALFTESYPDALSFLNEQLRYQGGVSQQITRMRRVPALWHVGKSREAEEEYAALKTAFSEAWSGETKASFYRMEAQLAYLRADWAVGVLARKRVLRAEPHPVNLPENWTLLGDGYAKLGENAAAHFAWEKAAAQPVESIWVRRAKERLEMR